MTAQAVGKHLRVLERAGLIERSRAAQLRPSRLRADAMKNAAEWIDNYREFWEAGFDRMQQRVQEDD
jgi:DNA-binding transcriptional ArsR family regulator